MGAVLEQSDPTEIVNTFQTPDLIISPLHRSTSTLMVHWSMCLKHCLPVTFHSPGGSPTSEEFRDAAMRPPKKELPVEPVVYSVADVTSILEFTLSGILQHHHLYRCENQLFPKTDMCRNAGSDW